MCGRLRADFWEMLERYLLVWDDIGKLFGRFVVDCWDVLGRSLGDVWKNVRRFLRGFGQVCGRR